ncbi:ATP-dependent RNA helicase [Penicillium rolfsii]|nr:ATP-dependent RNA helicase [Penicillium rolfsii]
MAPSTDQRPSPAALEPSSPTDETSATEGSSTAGKTIVEELASISNQLDQDDLQHFNSLEQKKSLQLDLEFSGDEFEGMTCFAACSIYGIKRDLQAVGYGMSKRDAKQDAIQVLISKLKETGIWEQLLQQDHTKLTVNDDLLYMIRFGTQSLIEANDNLRSFMSIREKQHRRPQKNTDAQSVYRTKRSEELGKALRKFRESKDPKVVAIRSATSNLPVNEHKEKVLDLIQNNTYSIIVAETGSGKSTQVPQMILNDAIEKSAGGYCNVLCIQPRRIAARLLAQRVADERLETIGNTVGYMIRFGIKRPAKGGSITYCTTGLALNLLQDNPALLNSFSHIILDEVHVRDIDIDFVMLLLKKHIDNSRAAGTPTPKIVVMSATVDVDLFASYFQNMGPDGELLPAPHVSIPGRQFHVKSHYLDEILDDITKTLRKDVLTWCLKEPSTIKFLQHHYRNFAAEEPVDEEFVNEDPLDETNDEFDDDSDTLLPAEETGSTIALSRPTTSKRVDDAPFVPSGLIAAVTHHLLSTTGAGSVLVFLPGLSQIIAAESQILQAAEMLELDFSNEEKFRILKLHSSLPEELAKLNQEIPKGCRRILLATDIAEASLTIPDVRYVIDSGKVNQLMYDPRTRSHQMSCCWASQSSTVQRAGRAGRVQDGGYFFLGNKECFDSLRITKSPEILRSDLQSVCLRAKLSDPVTPINEFLQQAIESPEAPDIDMAIDSLKKLQALDDKEGLTNLGSLVSHMPVLPPHFAKLVILGAIFQCLDPLLIVATLGEETNFFYRGSDDKQRQKTWNDQAAFAGQSSSDHFSTINAFKAVRSVWNESGWRAGQKFAFSRNVYVPVYREAFLTANQILGQLEQAQIISKWLSNDKDPEYRFGGPKLNVNSNHVPLIKALLLHCLYPRLAAPKLDSNTTFLTQTEKKAVLHAGSMTKNGKQPPRALLIFNQKFLWGSPPGITGLKEASIVTPLTACLFGGKLAVQRSSIVMDSWMRTRVEVFDSPATPNEVVRDVVELNNILNKALNTMFDSYPSDFRTLQIKKNKGNFFSARHHFVVTLQQTVKSILDRDCNPARTSAPAAWTEHDTLWYLVFPVLRRINCSICGSPLTAFDILSPKKFKLLSMRLSPTPVQQAQSTGKDSKMALSKSESDIILNRANVALARSQRLVASWLPEKTTSELASAKSEEELQREEDEIFTAVPETLGVGAPLPEKAADGSWNRTELSSNDALRKQLLGRNYDKFMKAAAEKKQASAAAKVGASAATTAGKSSAGVNNEDEDDDDEEGRVSMVGMKNKKRRRVGDQGRATPAPAAGNSKSEDVVEKGDNGTAESEEPINVKQGPAKGRKKATSYLDELLAERSKKRKKR